jgi:hypothetical protein
VSAPALATPAKAIRGSGRPAQYKLANGTRIPSVTTITGRFRNASALLAWANREGLEGRTLNEARDDAAHTGHIVHQWIQDSIHQEPLTDFGFSGEETLQQARVALEAFHQWAAEVRLQILATEIPIVSETLRLGGTLDAIGLVHGVRSLLDWKSGNGIYAEHLQQQAAYRQLLREQSPDLIPEQAVLIRLDKETGQPSAKIYDSDALDLAWEYFGLARQLYELDKDVEKLARRGRKCLSKPA